MGGETHTIRREGEVPEFWRKDNRLGGTNKPYKVNVVVSDQFSTGLKVLVVDDDVTRLRILEQMLRYHVTTCSQATIALNILREKKDCFDIVLSDARVPGMIDYKLLEHVGLETDLPIIMMSADGRTGAFVRIEALKNIWQYVVRKITL
ncbi:hypothetical protein VitviT2T_021850 [Vitis vinifera]|uniref:Response regulatory domain-containing protein n=1 Tax=Vitis vinifera TaxID=29760 RepID=A0ABY9DAJ0_VITVI|nr:hypothetical protein VitviT2T_021850 [Vitis vinifera]